VAVQELRFGDNDTLSAQVATLVEADYLFLVTDVDALYTANPKVRIKWWTPRRWKFHLVMVMAALSQACMGATMSQSAQHC
jgi:glutamate 5-kinase